MKQPISPPRLRALAEAAEKLAAVEAALQKGGLGLPSMVDVWHHEDGKVAAFSMTADEKRFDVYIDKPARHHESVLDELQGALKDIRRIAIDSSEIAADRLDLIREIARNAVEDAKR